MNEENRTFFEKHHIEKQKRFRAFAEKEIRPYVEYLDEKEVFPREILSKMAAEGYLGMVMPKKYGGQQQDLLSLILCIEEISKVCPAVGVILSTHTLLCAKLLETWGTTEQKERYLPALASGEKLGAFAITEPGAGTDIKGIQTEAKWEKHKWVLNGEKIFITNGGEADLYLVFAVTQKGDKKEITAFLVEKGTPGFSFGKKEEKMGIRASSNCSLFFKNCGIPEENQIGALGEGIKIALETLDYGRIGIAAQALGIGEGALDQAVKYVKQREQFGRKVSQFQNTRFQIAQTTVELYAASRLVYEAALCKKENPGFRFRASAAKLYASQSAVKAAEQAVQMLGGNGYLRKYGVERMMRDAKITEIYEGTSEAQKMVIADAVLR